MRCLSIRTGSCALFAWCIAIAFDAAPAFAEKKAPDWVKVTAAAPWQPRDSSGEVVFADKLWLIGGWFNSFEAPPRDIWSSADGRDWKRAAQPSPFKHTDLPMMLSFGGKMWFLGGWYNGRLPGHSASSEVWSTSDGEKWEQVTSKAAWSPRLAAGAVVFKDKMWILGGTEDYYFGDEKSLKNDVWSSSDGKVWQLVTDKAPWSPRAYHAAVVHDGKMWVLGGGNYVPRYQAKNDVWCSSDGVSWTQVVDAAPWHPRLWFSAVVYRNRMWVLGGWTAEPTKNWGDVWTSADGKSWQQLKSDVIWKERHEHSTYVLGDKLFVAGGHAQPLTNDVWSLELPKDWLEEK